MILSKIFNLETKSLDNSAIDSNPWLAGFSDADSGFSINIHNRTNKNSTRVQIYYRLEIRQTYHRFNNDGEQVSYFSILSKVSTFLETNILSRTRIKGDKHYFSFTIIAHNKRSLNIITEYFSKFPLLSSKYLDYKAFKKIFELQQTNTRTTTYLEEAINTRKDFNSTRTTYNWNHLKNCYLTINL